MKTITSQMFSLKTKDFLKALLIAVLMPVLLLIQESIAAGEMAFNWKELGMAAVAGFVGYLIKNFFTPAQIVITGTEVTKAVEEQKSKANV